MRFVQSLICLSMIGFLIHGHVISQEKDQKKEPSFDELWTPKPATSPDAEPWEKEKDKDWYDDRSQSMNKGPFYSFSAKVPGIGMIPKAISVKLGNDGFALYDTQQCSMRVVWTSKYLNMKPKRFGLLEMPEIAGDLRLLAPPEQLWQIKNGKSWDDIESQKLQYQGLKLWGDKVVFDATVDGRKITETAFLDTKDASKSFTYYKSLAFGPSKSTVRICVTELRDIRKHNIIRKQKIQFEGGEFYQFAATAGNGYYTFSLPGKIGVSQDNANIQLEQEDSKLYLVIGPSKEEWVNASLAVTFSVDADVQPEIGTRIEKLEEWKTRYARNWQKTLTVKGKLGTSDGPFALDTIPVPFENPYKALFYTSGVDFMPDGSLMVCTAHGDVWHVTGVDDDLKEVTWKRFATGLYQPLGLKVRNGEIFVIGRDQITRLHDKNKDGEADYYECFNNDLDVHGTPHAYAMCLEMDPEGNFYFLKSGRGQKPHGGSLLKVSADGKSMTRIASGFRHPNGLGVGPKGQITAADNEGNWIPKTRIDWIKEGGFYGHMPTHQMEKDPETYDPPICWLPKWFDNSAGGQVWVPENHWGPLGGQLIHLSYGRCWPLLVLHEEVNGVKQGGTVKLPVERALSGIMRGRFHPDDGHLYTTGLDGWQTAAANDGCLHRIRYTGKDLLIPTSLKARKNGIELGFAVSLDRKSAERPENYNVEIWNYRWSEKYGSDDYRVSKPKEVGHDQIPVNTARLMPDGKTVFLEIPSIRPVMQMGIKAALQTVNGENFPLELYNTIHNLGPEKKIP